MAKRSTTSTASSTSTKVVQKTPLAQILLPTLRFLTFTTGLVSMVFISIYWYLMSRLRYQVEDYPWTTILSYAIVFALGLGYCYSFLFPSLLGKESRLVCLLILSVTVLVIKFRILVPSGFDGCDREVTCRIEFAEIVSSMVLGFLVLPEMALSFVIARRTPNGKVPDYS
ncbi:hypothetical protein BGX24_008997 [Mortierella sp. AD032]|nr:hypothetical protein BGX24_008997 [Mortierella sp. AD032]